MLVGLLQSPLTLSCEGPRTAGELAETLWGAGSGYRSKTRPTEALAAQGESRAGIVPVEQVAVQLQIFSITDVSTKQQTFDVEAFIRVIWYDWRLRYTPFSEGGCFADPLSPEGEAGFDYKDDDNDNDHPIWIPGMAILNVVAEVKTLYGAFWVYPDGRVWLTRKIQAKLACSMYFAAMPYDTQTCPFEVAGWRDHAHVVNLSFYDGTPARITPVKRGVVDWDLLNVTGRPLDQGQTGMTGSAGAGLTFDFVMQRRSNYYETNVILPCVMIVAFAWLSFFISRDAVPARTALPILAFLVLRNQATEVLADLPRLTYSIWLETFLWVSSLFVLAAAFEYAACNVLQRIRRRYVAAERMRYGAIAILNECRAKEKGLRDIEIALADYYHHPEPPVTIHEIESRFLSDVGRFGIRLLRGHRFCASMHEIRTAVTQALDAVEGAAHQAVDTVSHAVDVVTHHDSDSPHKPRPHMLRRHATATTMPKPNPPKHHELKIKDQDLDIAFRIVFPVAYGLFVVVAFASAP